MIKNLLFLFAAIILTTSTLAISLNFNETKVGSERKLDSGSIIIDPGSHQKDSVINVSVDSISAEKKIQDLIKCKTNCDERSSEYYAYTGATQTEITDSNFLTGIRIRKGSIIDIAAKFNISNTDANYPDTPTIDVGNDGVIEWEFQGKAPEKENVDWNVNPYLGPDINPAGATELNLDSEGTCQQIFLNKSTAFKVSSTLKKSVPNPPSIAVYIQGYGDKITLESCVPLPLQDTFSEVECTISLTEPINSGEYKVCLTTTSTGIILAANDTATNSNGYRCEFQSCNKVPNTNFAIKAKASNFLTTLQESLEYFKSNTNPEFYFKDAIANFLQACNYQDDYCVIPINISTKNNNNVKIHSLDFKETLSDGLTYNRNKFLLGIESKGEKPYYEITAQKTIPLSQFNLIAPKELGSYTLKVEHGGETATANLQVVPAPTARFNVSSILAQAKQPITFDASASTSPSGDTNLTYLWEFGDNATSNEKITKHSYISPGEYTVKLTVKDQNNVPDTKTLQIEIFTEAASKILVENTLSRLETLKGNYENSTEDIKEIYFALGLDKKIQESIKLLQTTPQLTESEVNDELNKFPARMNVKRTIKISPYLYSAQINELYGFESDSYKTTLQELNSRFEKEVTARKVSLVYPTKEDSFIFVKKKIKSPEPITDITVIETIPTSLSYSTDSLEFLDSFPEITRLQNYQSAKFTIPSLYDEFTLYYKIDSDNLDAVKDTILIVMPQDLSPALLPFNCGDSICNPAEDPISCPEDCHCGNNQCDPNETEVSCPQDCKEFPWPTLIITILLVAGSAFSIYKFKIYEKLKIDELIYDLTAKFRKSPFKSGMELAKVRRYIKSALEKGYDKARIQYSLIEKGWSKEQIDYAFKKLEKKKDKESKE